MEDEYSTIMYVCSYMMKSEKAMGITLKRVAKECHNDDIQTQMNKIKKRILRQKKSCWNSQISHVVPVNVDH